MLFENPLRELKEFEMSKPSVTKRDEIETFETILLSKRAELLARIEQYRREMLSDRDPDDEGATALRSVERELAATNWDRAMRALREVEGALRSIEADEYGSCTTCGEPISEARLRALPWTRVCVECAGGAFRRAAMRDDLQSQLIASVSLPRAARAR